MRMNMMVYATLTECVTVTVDLSQNQVNIVTSDDSWHGSEQVHRFWSIPFGLCPASTIHI